jgi:cell division protein FtsX
MKLSAMFFLGLVLFSFSVLLDEGTTFILMEKGFGVLESNPVYHLLGLYGFITASVIFTTFILWAWYNVIKNYQKFYSKKYIFYKLYDIFVFLFCLFLITLSVIKIDLGRQNISTLVNYQDAEKRAEMTKTISYYTNLKESNLVQYRQEMTDTYTEVQSITVWKMFIITLLSYLLFRVGNKVEPWALD